MVTKFNKHLEIYNSLNRIANRNKMDIRLVPMMNEVKEFIQETIDKDFDFTHKNYAKFEKIVKTHFDIIDSQYDDFVELLIDGMETELKKEVG